MKSVLARAIFFVAVEGYESGGVKSRRKETTVNVEAGSTVERVGRYVKYAAVEVAATAGIGSSAKHYFRCSWKILHTCRGDERLRLANGVTM